MKLRVVVLGAGFGGLELSALLSEALVWIVGCLPSRKSEAA